MPPRLPELIKRARRLALERDRLVQELARDWSRALKGQGFVNLTMDDGLLLASTRGEVWCIDLESGRLLWQNPLTGLGWGLATFATAGGESQAVNAAMLQQQEQSNSVATAGTIAATTSA